MRAAATRLPPGIKVVVPFRGDVEGRPCPRARYAWRRVSVARALLERRVAWETRSSGETKRASDKKMAVQSQRIVQLWQLVSSGKISHSSTSPEERCIPTNHVLDGSRIRVSDQMDTRRRTHNSHLAVELRVGRRRQGAHAQ